MPSKFELATKELGFESATKQEALLKIFNLAGYFQPARLWHDIVCFDKVKAEKMFISINYALAQANANQDDPNEFNAKSMRKNLFKGDDILDVQTVKDLLLYLAQNAFNRQLGQERNELASQNWMVKYQDDYIAQAQKLGLIDKIAPSLSKYDEALIAGASRIGLLARILDFNNKEVTVNGEVLILAGERPLWANIDGINPETYQILIKSWKEKADINSLNISLPAGEDPARIEEGKKYLQYLADKYNISLNQEQPFIIYTKETTPKGLFPSRVYPNYVDPNGVKLTESLMSRDLLEQFLNVGNAKIIDTKLGQGNKRPDTASTANDAAKDFITRILQGEFGEQKDFTILFESNNPYIKRQTLATQREFDKILKEAGLVEKDYHLKIEGVGFAAKQDVTTIHSELAALTSEEYKNSTLVTYANSHIKDLMFQTRICSDDLPPMPIDGLNEVNIWQNLMRGIQNIFDEQMS